MIRWGYAARVVAFLWVGFSMNPSISVAACGGLGERACCFCESNPGCQSGLVEIAGCAAGVGCNTGSCEGFGCDLFNSNGVCVDPGCGGEGERACCILEASQLGYACEPGLIQDFSSEGDCQTVLGASNCECVTGGIPSAGICTKPKDVGELCTFVPETPCKDGLVCHIAGLKAYCGPPYNGGEAFDRTTCAALYNPLICLAQRGDPSPLTVTFGTSAAANCATANASVEVGNAYGRDGKYGCYRSTCSGGVTIDCSTGISINNGRFDQDFDQLAGADVQSCLEIGSPFAQVSSGLCDVFQDASACTACCPAIPAAIAGQCDNVGYVNTISFGIGLSPVTASALECQTTLLTVGTMNDSCDLVLNQPPTCSGGSYTVECNGTSTSSVALSNASASDPDNDALTYSWSTACPGGSFSNKNTLNPTLSLTSDCNSACSATLTVSDGQESASCTASISLHDTTAPTITCPADATLECSGLSTNTSPAATGSASGQDACDASVSIASNDVTVPGCGNTKTITRNWTATDDCSHSKGCAQTITVRDTTPPSITCPADISRETSPGQCSLSVSYAVTTSDGCDGGPVLSCSDQTSRSVSPTGDTFPVGHTTVTCTSTDCTGNSRSCSFGVDVNDRPQITSITPASQTVQYSDTIAPVTIVATDCGPGPLTMASSGVASALTLPATATSCSATSSGVECSFTLSGQIKVPSGSYPVTVIPADEMSVTGTSQSIGIQVAPEDARATLSSANPVLIDVLGPGGDSVAFALTADVEELVPDVTGNTALPGDIKNAVATVTLTPVGPGSSETSACTALNVPPADAYGAAGGVLEVSCAFSDVPVNVYQVTLEVGSDTDGVYYRGADNDVVTVFDPSLGFVTGGGWFPWPGTEDRTTYGLNAKYNKKGTNVQGSVLVIRHLPDGTKYRIKSNALAGLSLGGGVDFGWAALSGKSTYQEPSWPDAIGNHLFTAYVEDHGEPGAGVDRFWVEVRDQDGNLVTLAMPEDAVSNAATISGGNIAVPHQTGKRTR